MNSNFGRFEVYSFSNFGTFSNPEKIRKFMNSKASIFTRFEGPTSPPSATKVMSAPQNPLVLIFDKKISSVQAVVLWLGGGGFGGVFVKVSEGWKSEVNSIQQKHPRSLIAPPPQKANSCLPNIYFQGQLC